MKGTSKVIMGATLAIAIALAIILALVLILLAELYCSLFLSRRCDRKTQTPTVATASADTSLRTLLAQGVVHAPRSFLFPKITTREDEKHENKNLDLEKQDHIETIVGRDCSGDNAEGLVYICNPIYDNKAACPGGDRTPYETPESSPSHLGFSDDGEGFSPELVPIQKLQAEACSVSLRDASSLATSPSGIDTNSNNGVSTTASGSPRTSPSW